MCVCQLVTGLHLIDSRWGEALIWCMEVGVSACTYAHVHVCVFACLCVLRSIHTPFPYAYQCIADYKVQFPEGSIFLFTWTGWLLFAEGSIFFSPWNS